MNKERVKRPFKAPKFISCICLQIAGFRGNGYSITEYPLDRATIVLRLISLGTKRLFPAIGRYLAGLDTIGLRLRRATYGLNWAFKALHKPGLSGGHN